MTAKMTRFTVNGNPVHYLLPADTPLLWALRDASNLTGTKFGCGAGLCGACTVHLDGKATRSCQVAIGDIEGSFVTTIEGLSPDRSHIVQAAWVAEQVPQCGYCQSGMIMAVAALLKATPQPTDDEIDAGITNICRCGTYPRIRQAIHAAAAGVVDAGVAPPGATPSEAVRHAPSMVANPRRIA